MLAISLAFVAIGLLVPGNGDGNWRPWCFGFFGLCSAIFLFLLVRPPRLKLDAQGFVVSGGLTRSPRVTAWTDVDSFFVLRISRGSKVIGYNLKATSRMPPTSAFAQRFAADGVLSKLWPGSPERMAEELNDYRARALSRGSL